MLGNPEDTFSSVEGQNWHRELTNFKLLACWVIFPAFVVVCCQLTFFKIPFRNTIRVSNGLDPDQDRHSVGPDLGPNCLQRLSADDKSPLAKKDFKQQTQFHRVCLYIYL